MPPRIYPPRPVKIDPLAIPALTEGLRDYAVEAWVGPDASLFCHLFLRDHGGRLWDVWAHPHDLEPLFEIFALNVEGRASLEARFPPGTFSDPEGLFTPWPFQSWRVEALHRQEGVFKLDDDLPTFGDGPIGQGAAEPGSIPDGAEALCEVGVGLLFTGDNGKRLLIGVDWQPLALLMTSDDARIDAYLAPCVREDLTDYLRKSAS